MDDNAMTIRVFTIPVGEKYIFYTPDADVWKFDRFCNAKHLLWSTANEEDEIDHLTILSSKIVKHVSSEHVTVVEYHITPSSMDAMEVDPETPYYSFDEGARFFSHVNHNVDSKYRSMTGSSSSSMLENFLRVKRLVDNGHSVVDRGLYNSAFKYILTNNMGDDSSFAKQAKRSAVLKRDVITMDILGLGSECNRSMYNVYDTDIGKVLLHSPYAYRTYVSSHGFKYEQYEADVGSPLSILQHPAFLVLLSDMIATATDNGDLVPINESDVGQIVATQEDSCLQCVEDAPTKYQAVNQIKLLKKALK